MQPIFQRFVFTHFCQRDEGNNIKVELRIMQKQANYWNKNEHQMYKRVGMQTDMKEQKVTR